MPLALSYPVLFVLGLLTGPLNGLMVLLSLVLHTVVAGFGMIYLNVGLVVFYYDIRCRKEGFDLQMLAGMVDEPHST